MLFNSFMSNNSINYIIKPNKHNINNNNLNIWLNKSDDNIKNIANEFIMKTTYISYSIFQKYLKKCYIEMVSTVLKDVDILQFFIISEDSDVSYKNKSGYWIYKHLLSYINKNNYKFKIVNNIDDIDFSLPVIIPDDASYSGSQLSSFIEIFENKKIDLYLLIPFISNTAIDIIKNSHNEYNIEGDLHFPKNKFIIKPIYDLMEDEKIEKLFSYYTKNGKNIREYPIYFDHKVADNYSSFPLIYTFGIIPNTYNKNIIQMCKKNLIPLADHFSKLERIVILNNCPIDLKYNIATPPCPLQPYKKNFNKISKSNYKSNSIYNTYDKTKKTKYTKRKTN